MGADRKDRTVGRGFPSLSLLPTWAAESLYNSPVFPYSPVLLPSSRNALYLLLIHTFPLEPIVTVHERSLELYP